MTQRRAMALKGSVALIGLALVILGMSSNLSVQAAGAGNPGPNVYTCEFTRVRAGAVQHTNYDNNQIAVYVTLDELVDVNNGTFCGSIRVHAQVRLYSNIGGSHDVAGRLYAGPNVNSLNSRSFTPNVITGSGPGTWDAYGPWVSQPCGEAEGLFDGAETSGYVIVCA